MTGAIRFYRLPEDALILNEMTTALWFCNYHPSKVQFLWANAAAVRMWNKQDLTDMLATDIFNGRSDAVRKLHDELYHKVQVEQQTETCRRTMYPGGQSVTVDCEFCPISVELNGVKQTIAIVRAVPVRVEEGQMEVNRSHEMLRHSPIMCALFNMNGECIQSNVAARTFYCYRGEQQDITLQDVVESCQLETGLDAADVIRQIKEMSIGDATFKLEVAKIILSSSSDIDRDKDDELKNDEQRIWHDVQFIPTTDPVTGFPSILLIESDITALEQMKAVEAQLIQAYKQKEQFFAAISHELRTPLNGIIGLTESMIDDDDLNESARHTLGIILKSATRLNVLINDILDAASLKQGTLKMRMGPVDVNEAIEQVCEHLKILSQGDVELKKTLTAELPMASGDHQRILQILTNLVGNSLKFTQKGTVTIWAEHHEDSGCLEIFVKDTGIGIASDELESVFQPFSQGDMSSTRSYEGTGLGLALVQSLVQGHGGDIRIESTIGKGTTVSFTLNLWGDVDQNAQDRTELDAGDASSGIMISALDVDSSDDDHTVLPLMNTKADKPRRKTNLSTLGNSFTLKANKGSVVAATKGGGRSETEVVVTPIPVVMTPIPPGANGHVSPPRSSAAARKSPVPSPGRSKLSTLPLRDLEAENEKLLLEIDDLKTQLDRCKMPLQIPGTGGPGSFALTCGGWTGSRSGLAVTQNGDASEASIAKLIQGIETPRPEMTVLEMTQLIAHRDEVISTLRQANKQLEAYKPDASRVDVPSYSDLNKGKYEIMCVDDNEINHSVVRRALEPSGFVVTHCHCGQACLDLLKERTYFPDLILLDLMMPVMNGTQVVRQIRTLFPTVHLPVIMVSARSDELSIVDNLSPAGSNLLCNDFVTKPFRAKELIARINSQLKTHQGWKLELRAASNAAAIRQLLPGSIAERMIKGILNVDQFPNVSCLVLEVSGLSEIAGQISIERYLGYQKRLYTMFDDIVQGGYRVDMPGEGYVVVIGHECNQMSPRSLVLMSEALLGAAATCFLGEDPLLRYALPVRIGICTGPAFASVVGTRTPRYLFFGEAVIGATALQVEAPDNCVLVCNRTMKSLQGGTFQDCQPYGRPEQEMYVVSIGNFKKSLEDARESGPTKNLDTEGIPQGERLFDKRLSISSASDGSTYVRTTQMQMMKYPSLVEALQTSFLKKCAKESSDFVLQELESCSSDLQEKMMELQECQVELQECQETREAMKEEVEKLKAECETASQGLSAARLTIALLESEAQELRKAHTRMTSRTMNDDSCSSESSTAGPDLVTQVEGSSSTSGSNRLLMSTLKSQSMSMSFRGQTRDGGEECVVSPTLSADAPSAEPPILCHEELYGQIEIMSVDDTPMNHLVIERILKRTGYKMTSCMDGVLFLKLLDERGYLPDILLLDVMMPNMSGHEVCLKLREKYPMATLPIIMISAKSNQENILEGFSSGCMDYVVKPFSRHELLARINVHVRQKDLFAKNFAKTYERRQHGIGARALSSGNSEKLPLLHEHLRSPADNSNYRAALIDTIPSATVMMADISNYEQLSSNMCAEDLYHVIGELFLQADAIATRHDVTFVDHIGDYLMFVSENAANPAAAAKQCVEAGLELLEIVRKLGAKSATPSKKLGLACGIQSGPVFSCLDRADVLSDANQVNAKRIYFGQTVNQAFELEEHGPSMTITLGAETTGLVGDHFSFEAWGWKQPYPRFLLKHDSCDWNAAMNLIGTFSRETSSVGLDGVDQVDLSGIKNSGTDRVAKRRRQVRNIKILELELQSERERMARMAEKASRLEAEVSKLRLQMDDNCKVTSTGAEDAKKLMEQVVNLENERRELEKKLAAATAVSSHGSPSLQALPTLPDRRGSMCPEARFDQQNRHASPHGRGGRRSSSMAADSESSPATPSSVKDRFRLSDRASSGSFGKQGGNGITAPWETSANATGFARDTSSGDTHCLSGPTGAAALNDESETLWRTNMEGSRTSSTGPQELREAQRENAALRVERAQLKAIVRELKRDNDALAAALHNSGEGMSDVRWNVWGDTSGTVGVLSPEMRRGIVAELKSDLLSTVRDLLPMPVSPATGGHVGGLPNQHEVGSKTPLFRGFEPPRGADYGDETHSSAVRGLRTRTASGATVFESPEGKLVISDNAAVAGGRGGYGDSGIDLLACTVTLSNLAVPEGASAASLRTITDLVGRWGTPAHPVRMVRDGRHGRFIAVVEMHSQEQAARVASNMDGASYNGHTIRALCALSRAGDSVV